MYTYKIIENEKFTFTGKKSWVDLNTSDDVKKLFSEVFDSNLDKHIFENQNNDFGKTTKCSFIGMATFNEDMNMTYYIGGEFENSNNDTNFTSFDIEKTTYAVFEINSLCLDEISKMEEYAFEQFVSDSDEDYVLNMSYPQFNVFIKGEEEKTQLWIPVNKK